MIDGSDAMISSNHLVQIRGPPVVLGSIRPIAGTHLPEPYNCMIEPHFRFIGKLDRLAPYSIEVLQRAGYPRRRVYCGHSNKRGAVTGL